MCLKIAFHFFDRFENTLTVETSKLQLQITGEIVGKSETYVMVCIYVQVHDLASNQTLSCTL